MSEDRPRPFKVIKGELVTLKEAHKSAKIWFKKPLPPWPVKVTCEAEQGHPYAWDTDNLKVRLLIEGPKMKDFPVRVELPNCKLPSLVQTKVVALVEEKWKNALKEQLSSSETRSWFLPQMVDWIVKNFDLFMRSVPDCVEMYMGCSSSGATMRRYTVVEPKDSSESEVEEVEKELTPEQIARREAAEQRRLQRERERLHKAACEAEAKKQKAMRLRAMGIETNVRMESKKEREARLAARKKQGVRMRKTGARATKYAGPGSAVEAAMSKKERKRLQKEREGN